MKFSKVKALATTGATAIYLGLMNAQVVFAADGGEVKSKLTSAGKTINWVGRFSRDLCRAIYYYQKNAWRRRSAREIRGLPRGWSGGWFSGLSGSNYLATTLGLQPIHLI